MTSVQRLSEILTDYSTLFPDDNISQALYHLGFLQFLPVNDLTEEIYYIKKTTAPGDIIKKIEDQWHHYSVLMERKQVDIHDPSNKSIEELDKMLEKIKVLKDLCVKRGRFDEAAGLRDKEKIICSVKNSIDPSVDAIN